MLGKGPDHPGISGRHRVKHAGVGQRRADDGSTTPARLRARNRHDQKKSISGPSRSSSWYTRSMAAQAGFESSSAACPKPVCRTSSMSSWKLVPGSPLSVACIKRTPSPMRSSSFAEGLRPFGQTSRRTSVMPTTFSAMGYFLILGWDAMLMVMTWNLSPGDARTSASIHDATPPSMYGYPPSTMRQTSASGTMGYYRLPIMGAGRVVRPDGRQWFGGRIKSNLGHSVVGIKLFARVRSARARVASASARDASSSPLWA